MKRHSVLPAIFAMVTVAFLFALAPAFHAVCVSALSHSSESHMSHVMADGTVMNMTTEVTTAVMNMDSSLPNVPEGLSAITGSDTAHVMGNIMITAGLTLLTFLAFRYCKHVLAREFRVIATQLASAIIPTRGIVRARPPSQVDLNMLCISRT
ncbi:hypothetical protein [Aurantimicrobium minutum]|uniref:hypothetical protein n=1 Tax=Aurantimicrobium minutum TaxID=708131 RepID=UPI00247546E1|nr:hypothetical protein [Aurantimicrobium minutum]MDH6423291.1 hypothetical protein [Aurantimicrobium minutum]